MARFRGKLLAAVDAAAHRGRLTLPDGMPLRPGGIVRNKLGRQQWNVYIRERYPPGTGVITYVARDIRGGPIAKRRLVACERGVVTFGYRRNGEGAGDEPTPQGRMRVSIDEFIRRYRVHGPPPGTRGVRADGLYAPTQGAAWA
jgi:hypothetical protein